MLDKTYDDIISDYQRLTIAQSSSKRWHGIFYSNGYVVTNMATLYGDYYDEKAAELTTVLNAWAELD